MQEPPRVETTKLVCAAAVSTQLAAVENLLSITFESFPERLGKQYSRLLHHLILFC